MSRMYLPRIQRMLLVATLAALTPAAFAMEAPASRLPSYVTAIPPDNNADPNALPKASFQFMQMVDSMERDDEGSGVRFLEDNINFERRDALDYLEYIRTATTEYEHQTRMLLKGQCDLRSKLQTPEALAKSMNDVEQALEASQVRMARDAVSVLGEANAIVIDAFVSAMFLRTQRLYRIDHLKSMKDTGTSPDEILQSICNRTSR